MLKDFKNIFKHTAIYTVGNMATKLLGILLIPLYTSVIVTEIFGIYSILEVTMQFLLGIFHLGIPDSMFRWFNLEEKKNKSGVILFSGFMLVFVMTSLLLVVLLLFGNFLSTLFFDTVEYSGCFYLIGIIVLMNLLNLIGLTLLRVNNKSFLFILVSISKLIFQLSTTIYFVAYLKMSVFGIFLGQIIGEGVILIIIFPYILKNFVYKIDIKETKTMIKFGFPLVFSGVSNRILNMGDRYVLAYLTDLGTVGIYSLGYKFANLIDTIFINALRSAFLPQAWKKLREGNAKDYYSKLLTYYVFIIFWIALGISVFAKEIIMLFARNESYWSASIIVPMAAFAIGIKGIFVIVKMGMQFKFKTKYIAYIVMGSAFLNILLNFIFIPYLGMVGAALATVFSFVIMVIVSVKISNKFYPIQFEWKRIIKLIFVIFSLLYLNTFLTIDRLWINILVKILLLMTYPLILFIIRFFTQNEIFRLKGSWKKWKNPKNWKVIIGK